MCLIISTIIVPAVRKWNTFTSNLISLFHYQQLFAQVLSQSHRVHIYQHFTQSESIKIVHDLLFTVDLPYSGLLDMCCGIEVTKRILRIDDDVDLRQVLQNS